MIPLVIYQTWETKNLPPIMKTTVDKLKQQNPQFTHYLFDNNDCREFIKKYFNTQVLEAYDSLIPGAYKADLWRYCVLYINGGIYLDIKYNHPDNNFSFIDLDLTKDHYVLDRTINNEIQGIYNALIITHKCSIFLCQAIKRIVENVKNKYYGIHFLEPTGPLLLYNLIKENNYNFNINMKYIHDKNLILYQDKIFLYIYPKYRNEQQLFFKNNNTKYYRTLWEEKNIYKI